MKATGEPTLTQNMAVIDRHCADSWGKHFDTVHTLVRAEAMTPLVGTGRRGRG